MSSEEIETGVDENDEAAVETKGAYVPGTLYIMNETDYLTGESFEYYKIGIVRGEKDVAAREKEHRTGNPRRISSVRDIVSPAVQKLETRLHNEFAKHRTSSGEWFYLPGGRVDEVIARAVELNAELEAHIDALNLGKTISAPGAGPAITPSPTIAADADALAGLMAKLEIVKANQKAVNKLLSEQAEGNPEWDFLFERRNVAATNKFSADLVKKNFKELYEKYKTLPSSTVNPKWIVSKAELEAADALAELGLSLAADLGTDPLNLHQAHLAHWSAKAAIDWQIEIVQACLLSEARYAAGIEGVLEWNFVESVKFDSPTFKAENPDIYAQCFKSTDAKVSYRVVEWASYSL